MEEAQLIPGELRTSEDGQTVIVLRVNGQEVAIPVQLGEGGKPEPVKCRVESVYDDNGVEIERRVYPPCLAIVNRAEAPNMGGSDTDA